MKRYLLDSSALRLLALEDPDAVAANEWQRRTEQSITVPLASILETYKAFTYHPFHSEASRRCQFIQKLHPLHVAQENARSILDELSSPDERHRCQDIQATDLAMLRLRLNEASMGAPSPAILRSTRQHFNYGKQSTEKMIAEVQQNQHLAVLKEIESFEDVLNAVDLESYAVSVIENLVTRVAFRTTKEDVVNLARRSVEAPLEVPTTTGVVRINCFTSWKAVRARTMAHQDDLNLIGTALSFEGVVSSDKKFLKRGLQIFPEVRWISTRDFLDTVNRP